MHNVIHVESKSALQTCVCAPGHEVFVLCALCFVLHEARRMLPQLQLAIPYTHSLAIAIAKAIYESAFVFWDTAYATTLSVVLILLLCLIAIGQFFVLDKKVHYQ